VSERGSVSIVVAAILATCIVLAIGAADVTRVLAVAARAQTAADAAALAAAQELALPSGLEPVDVARDYAARNGASLVACTCARETFDATVRVRVAVGSLLLFADDRVVEAQARAVVDLPSFSPSPSP
jgi:secretion/DNA translocation related TadE-like protein